VDLEVREPPPVRGQGAEARVERVGVVAVPLLEVVRIEGHPLIPDDPVPVLPHNAMRCDGGAPAPNGRRPTLKYTETNHYGGHPAESPRYGRFPALRRGLHPDEQAPLPDEHRH